MRAPAALLLVALTVALAASWGEESGLGAGIILVVCAALTAFLIGSGAQDEPVSSDLSAPMSTAPMPEQPVATPSSSRSASRDSLASAARASSEAAMLLGLAPEPWLGRRHRLVAISGILLLAAALRMSFLAQAPAGFFCDEATMGYNAFSLLETGRDEHGTLLPLFIPSFGTTLKNPAYVYAITPFVALFGLDERSVRLPAACYGVLAVLALYLLGRALYNERVGMLAALLLAISPHHLHFSRIAFELIALPTFFLFGFACLIRGIDQGDRWRFIAAGVLFGAMPYANSLGTAFVPLMLAGVVALYPRELWKHRRGAAYGVLAGLIVLLPLLYFKLFDPGDVDRFTLISIVHPDATWGQIWREFSHNYRQYLSFRFLFLEGDPIFRHSVRGFGENLLSLSPWIAIGLAAAFARARRGLLLVWWLLTFPVGASLLTETPSATRTIVGAPLFPLLGAVGLTAGWSLLAKIRMRPRVVLQGAFVVVVATTIGGEMARYLRSYFVEYPKYSAPSYEGWQYGYREVIGFMEQHRQEYDTLVLTATEVNQPWIFPLFYTRRDPRQFQATGDIGYDIFIPEEYARYDLERGRMLFAAHPLDIAFFEEFEVLHDVMSPGGEVVYRIIEPRRRKRFLDHWEVSPQLPAGLTEIPGGLELPEARSGWRPIESQFVYNDLNAVLEAPDQVCAVAATAVHLDGPARDAKLECIGTEDRFLPSLGSQRLGEETLERRAPRRFPMKLEPGDNLLRVLTCDTEGDWYFACSVVDDRGRSLDQVDSRQPSVTWPPL